MAQNSTHSKMVTFQRIRRLSILFRAPILSLLYWLSCGCTNGIMNVGSTRETDSLDTEIDTVTNTANTDGSGPDAGDACGRGVLYENLCWYLGENAQSCIEVCGSRGGYDDAGTSILGTPDQQGTWTACRDIIRLLGFDGEVAAGYRQDDLGLGCHIWDDGTIWWLYSPDFDPAAASFSARIVCSCAQNQGI